MVFDSMYVTYGLIALVVILVGLVVRLEIKIKKLLRGKNAHSLEDSIVGALENLGKLNTFQKEVIRHLEGVETRLNRSVQAVKTVRFNPFKGTGEGGSQSFSTAFITENGDGAVISSLYSRDRVSVFSKPLENFESTFELTDEEKEVISHSKDFLK
jgi:hypothetical protein